MHEGRALWLYVEWLVYLLRGHYTLTIWKQRTEKFWALWNCKTRSLVISGASQVSGIISNYRLLCKSLESLTSWHLTNNQINPEYSLYKAKFNVFWGKPAFVYLSGKLEILTNKCCFRLTSVPIIETSFWQTYIWFRFFKSLSALAVSFCDVIVPRLISP